MLQLLSGHYPTGPNEIALTPGLASELNLEGGRHLVSQGDKTVVGIVQNPQSLLDEFALVPPGQVTHPTTVDVLFDAPGVNPGRIGSNVSTPGSLNNNPINPDTIVLALATVGMLLIALVSVGGFTVLAQRRLRAIGMLESMGATDRNVRLVLRGQRRHRRRWWVRCWVSHWVWWPGSPTARTTSRARTTSSPCSPCRGR